MHDDLIYLINDYGLNIVTTIFVGEIYLFTGFKSASSLASRGFAYEYLFAKFIFQSDLVLPL